MTTVGIRSFGAYVPRTRLPLAFITGRPAKQGGPEKAVCAHDEDTLTMAVSAGAECLRGFDRASVDALYLATTTGPFAEKLNASLVAHALGLRREIFTLDLGGSLRSGLSALQTARDAVVAGSASQVLVIASDARLAPPKSPLERNLGDGAAAFLVSAEAPIATLDAHRALSDEMLDVWRGATEVWTHSWEDRFVVDEGVRRNVLEVGTGFIEEHGGAASFARLCLAAPDARSHGRLAKELGFTDERLEPAGFGKLGNTGSSFAPLLLTAALAGSEGSQALAAGDRLLVLAHGNGAEALALTVTEQLAALPARRGLPWLLAQRRPLASYDSYLAARHLVAREFDGRDGAGPPATTTWRDRDADLALTALRCTECQTMHFPVHRVCYRCFAKDRFEPVRLSDRRGRLLSHTLDHFFPSPEPPTAAGMVEVEGCRLYLQMTDVQPDQLRCDLEVEFVFRRMHEAGGRPSYYWKATPVPERS